MGGKQALESNERESRVAKYVNCASYGILKKPQQMF